MKDARQEYLWKVHDYISNHIRFADGKAALSFAFSSGLLSWLTTRYAQFSDAESFGLWSTLLLWSGITCLTASTMLFAWALIPRLWAKSKKGLIFWEQVALYDNGDAYSAALKATDADGLERALVDHIHIMARLASRKFALIGVGVTLAATGAVLLAWPLLKLVVSKPS